MERALLDGTTLMLAERLLRGVDRPSAFHLFSLNLLVESLVLHDQVIVLDTQHSQALKAAAGQWGRGVIKLESRTVREILDAYVALEFVELSRLPASRLTYEDLSAAERSAADRAEDHLHSTLEKSYWDDETRDYLALIQQHYREAGPRQPRVIRQLFPLLPRLPHSLVRGLSQLHDPATSLGHLAADDETRDGAENFVLRYTTAGSQSPWQQGAWSRRERRSEFTSSLLIRTHFYLLASELLSAPYRPDALRAPICWKYFEKGSFADLSVEERLVDAAQQMDDARIESLSAFLENPAIVGLPLFLARIMRESRSRADFLRVTHQIRASTEARRFREYAAALRRVVNDGEIEPIVRDLGRYAKLLRKEFGDERSPDVVWSLLGATAKATIVPSPGAFLDLGLEGGKAGSAISGWWRNRKFALISKTIRQAREAHTLQTEMKRLFGAELNHKELAFLDRLESLGHPSQDNNG